MSKYTVSSFSTLDSETPLEHSKMSKSDNGCFVRTTTGFVLVFLALAIAIGVGLIVHFVENRKLDCNWPDGLAEVLSSQQQKDQQGCPTLAPVQCPTCLTNNPSTPPATTPNPEDVRLPGNMFPRHYRLRIQPEMYGPDPTKFTFNGTVHIDIECKEPTDQVILHVNMLNVSDITFTSTTRAGNSPSYVSHHEDKGRQFLIIQLDQSTEPSHIYTLSMNFIGPLKDDLQGFYLSSYQEGGVTKYLATTQFEPTDARKAFPCFDEPSMKATFQMTLVRKTTMKSISNLPIAYSTTLAGGYVEDVFNISKAMSTYLVAYVVTDFSKSTGRTSNNLEYSAWTRPSMSDQSVFALNVGIKTIVNYETYFNISFPLPKQDMIAIPDFGLGAMENWGLITYRETAMLFKPQVSSERSRERVASVITHELAHQWFGDLVTMEWWDDIWLNEGFATFVEYIGVDFLFPEWNMFDTFPMNEIHSAFEFDSLVSSHPIYVPLSNPDEIHEVFDGISYAKGGSIIRMMRFILGENTFKKGLTRYLDAHKYGNANHDDLWRALSEQSKADNSAAPINVKEVMDTWTLQMNYPVVKVTYKNSRLSITQQRFLKDLSVKDPERYTSQFGYIWQIPFTFTSSLDPNFNVSSADIHWLKTSNIEFPVSTLPDDGWVLGNVEQYGFYRVNYEDSNWRALIRQLKIKHTVISTINRAQLINDAWSLSRAQQLSSEIALGMLEYLDQERSYGAWFTARQQVSFLADMLDKTDLYGQFQSFMQTKLKDPFEHYGMDDTNATHVESLTRSMIVKMACKFGIPLCISQSQRLFQTWMDSPDQNNPIDPDLRPAVYCTAIAEGGEEEWNFAFSQFQSVDVIAEKTTLAEALACTRLPWLLSKYLELSLKPDVIRKQDATNVIISIAHNPVGRLLAWDFVRGRWGYLQNTYGKGVFSFARLIEGLTSSFSTEFQLYQLQSFLEQHPDMGTGNRAFQQALEKTTSNMKWIDGNKDAIARWLESLNAANRQQVTDVRLPRHLEPIHYDLTLKPNMYLGPPEKFTFEGYVKIHMVANETGRNVTLHANKLTIEERSIKFAKESGQGGPSYNGQRMHDEDRQFEIFYLTEDIVTGEKYTIEMNFTGPLTDDLAGLYLSTYNRNNMENQTVYIATTQFEPTDARKAFPCFDEPELKAYFKVSLIRKNGLISISNMPIVATTKVDDDFMMDEYNVSAKMSTYLLAFIVCDFQFKSNSTAKGTQYRAFARPESVNQVDVALKAGVDILSFYETYFDIDFPLPKQDMIAIPDFSAGAMENWGLITYRETAMLYEPGVSSEGNLQRVNVVVAHELAHQWFGDLVTMEWWDDLWLNEGFATFVEYLGTDHQHPEWKMFDQFVLELHDVLRIDGLITSHPIYVPVQNPDEINEIFDTISYGKGGTVLRMTRFFLGESTFQRGVQRYLKNRKYANANHDDLWAGLQEQANEDKKNIQVKDVLDTWILQMNYPVVMVTNGTNGNIHITQERFLYNKEAKDPGKYPSPFKYTWKIPVTYTTSTGTNFDQTSADVVWLEDHSKDLGVPYPNNGWVIGNIQQYGVYRVNYDEANWNHLIHLLKTQHQSIHHLNRGQLINDAFGLAKAKQLNMETALHILEYLKLETEYIPWHSANAEIGYINIMLAETDIYGQFQRFVLDIVETQYHRLGLNNTGASHLDSYLRSDIANSACFYGNKACIKDSVDLFEKYRLNPTNNPIDPDLKTVVYCTAVREGGEEEWQFAFDLYQSATVQAEKIRLLYAMCCTKQTWIINKMLTMSLDPDIVKKQDADDVYVYVARSSVGRTAAWNFLKANFDTIFKLYSSGSFAFSGILKGVTHTFNTEYQLQEMKDFQKQHPDLGSGSRAFAQAIENTQSNIQWMNDNYSIVKKWLDNYTTATATTTTSAPAIPTTKPSSGP